MRNLVFILITFTWAGFRAEKIQDGSSTAKKETSIPLQIKLYDGKI